MNVAADQWIAKMEGKEAGEAETLREAEKQSREAEKELDEYLKKSSMSASLDSLFEGVLARGPLKLEARPKAPPRVPAARTTPM